MDKKDRATIQQEIEKNFQYFSQQEFSKERYGTFAIIKSCKIIEILDTRNDAKKLAEEKYKDGVYSIQEIQPRKIDLGFISLALRSN